MVLYPCLSRAGARRSPVGHLMTMTVRLCRSLLAAAAMCVAVAGTAAANVCATFASVAELEYRIPAGLLQAIASIESKHNPWAIAMGGKSVLPGSQEAAARLIRS